MTFTTHYFIGETKWTGDRIQAVSWADAEYQANIKGVILTGLLWWVEDEHTGEKEHYYSEN